MTRRWVHDTSEQIVKNEFAAFLYSAAEGVTLGAARDILAREPRLLQKFQIIGDRAEEFLEAHRAEFSVLTPEHHAAVNAAVAEATAAYHAHVKRLEKGIVRLTLLMADAGVDASVQAAKVLEQAGVQA